MDPLTRRDANTHMRRKQELQLRTAKSVTTNMAPKTQSTLKEKDHPLPPPPEVFEPPSSDRRNGATYKTGHLLGKGGFAICYEGRLSGTQQVYALKIVKSQMQAKKMEQKFQTELQIHSKMNHPNIVRFRRAFSFESSTYLVLELCPNGSLMDLVKKRKFVTEPEVRFWGVQMSGAIKYMHAKGIIHRDLKMGNIFLDKDMNVKIGDFGLAALFMSGKDWSNCRRTTLCGTPNYIAPEILSKEKGGHDHLVDIWSLGVIFYALLTGRPPFQSTTQEEIYRKAKAREYDWPGEDRPNIAIHDETKELVAMMLEDAQDRPNPDDIVQHPFFTCGWMPQADEMTIELRDKAPMANQFGASISHSGRQSLWVRNLKKLCMKCDVGPWSPPPNHTSTYRDVAAEEAVGLTPIVPLPEGIVYRPYDEWKAEQNQQVDDDDYSDEDGNSAKVLKKIYGPRDPRAMAPPPVPVTRTRPVAQSFAAQQRARPGTLQQSIRETRRQPPSETSRTVSESSSRPMVNTQARNSKSRKVETPVETTSGVKGRIAVDLINQLPIAIPESKPIQAETITLSLPKSASLFHPRENLETLHNSKPDHVLANLVKLQNELERALNSRSLAVETKTPPANPLMVVKWVDYTNKFGLGYILSNGSVGCVFRSVPADSADPSKGQLPPACVVVREAERHLQNKNNDTYKDRHQIVPISGPNIEFYENSGEFGILRGQVNPQNYKIAPPSKPGEVVRLARGVDVWDDRKRDKIVLWKKFANYMTAFGRDYDPSAAARQPSRADRSDKRSMETPAAGNVITFYQRWGDVGCWGFFDGDFQFNFPDHTKILISPDGTWCNFYGLPIEVARDFARTGTMPSSALDERQHLSYPLQTLLNFMAKPTKSVTRKRPEIDPIIQGIPLANDFRRKIEFIRDVVKEWVSNGGMGNSDMNPATRLRYTGYRELVNVKVPYKHVWVTVGARNGDDRKVAWFDPKTPNATLEDIES